MELEKYPVKGIYGDYLVTLEKSYVTCGMYEIIAKVKVKRDKKRFYQNEFKEVYRYSSGWSGYREWVLKLVEFSKRAVRDYEDTIIFEENVEKSIEEFEGWNGII